MVEHPIKMKWVVGSIPHGGPIELLVIPVSGVTKTMVCAILSVGWCI